MMYNHQVRLPTSLPSVLFGPFCLTQAVRSQGRWSQSFTNATRTINTKNNKQQRQTKTTSHRRQIRNTNVSSRDTKVTIKNNHKNKLTITVFSAYLCCFLLSGSVLASPPFVKRGTLRNLDADELIDDDIQSVAEFAAITLVKQEKRLHHEAVLQVIEGRVQTVAGRRLKLRIKLSPTRCSTNQSFEKKSCPPKDETKFRMCNVEVYERPWEHVTELTGFSCST